MVDRKILNKANLEGEQLNSKSPIARPLVDKIYLKFQRLPTANDKVVMKFTSKFNSFEILVKENETTEIAFPRNFLTECTEEISRRVNSVIDSTRSTEPNENRLSSHSPHTYVRTNSTLNTQSTLQDFDFVKFKDPFCGECSTKIEVLKTIMKELIEFDRVALPICADYTDYVINKMDLERKEITHDFASKDYVVRALITTSSTLRLLLDSCYVIAPYHSQAFEKLFKVLTYFFELMIRAHEYSNKSLIRKLEQ